MSRPLDSLRPGPDVQGFLQPFASSLMFQNPETKVGLAAFAIVVDAFVEAVTVLTIVAFLAWCLDFFAGVLRTLRDPLDTLDWNRAGDGFLKLGLYVVMWCTAVLMELVVEDAAQTMAMSLSLNGELVSGAAMVIIVQEVGSVAENVRHSMPRTDAFLGRLLTAAHLLRRPDGEPHLRDPEASDEES